MSVSSKRISGKRGSTQPEFATSDTASTNDARRDRWRREAGTARWQNETGVQSGAPAPLPPR